MKYIYTSLTLLITCLLPTQLFAVKIMECVDEAGNSTFQDRCPPGTQPVNEKSFYTGKKKGSPDAPDVAITFYTVPSCDACDLVRNLLESYNAGFSEKNIKDDVELQKELQTLTNATDALTVPTVVVGETTIQGYNKQMLISTLEDVGFKKPGSEEQAGQTNTN